MLFAKKIPYLVVMQLIAPAIPYEAARPDITQLNARLFLAAKAAGDALSIPTYATVVLGSSVTNERRRIDLTFKCDCIGC